MPHTGGHAIQAGAHLRRFTKPIVLDLIFVDESNQNQNLTNGMIQRIQVGLVMSEIYFYFGPLEICSIFPSKSSIL